MHKKETTGQPGIEKYREITIAVALFLLFDQTLKGFQNVATVPGGDGKPVFLRASEGPLAAGSRDCQKSIRVTVRMGRVLDLPAHKVNRIRDIAIQLVRNAVVHGVEDPAQRAALGKNAEGQLQVNLTREATA